MFCLSKYFDGLWFHSYRWCQLLAMRTTAGIDVNVDGLMRIQIDAAINPGLLTRVGPDVDTEETLKNSRKTGRKMSKTWFVVEFRG